MVICVRQEVRVVVVRDTGDSLVGVRNIVVAQVDVNFIKDLESKEIHIIN